MSDFVSEASLTWQVTPEMLCVIRRDGVFQAVNPAWERVLGWSQDEITGRSYAEFVHEADLLASAEAFETAAEGTPVLKFANRYRAKDGNYRWLQWVAVPEADLIVCTARDVTESRQNVETIEEQRTEAALREQFLAVLGHDLRNPLAAVISGVTVLSRRVEDPAHRRIIESMRQSAARMTELVNNMMDFARVRLGDGIGLNLTTVTDLEPTIRRIVDEIKDIAPDIEFQISTEANGEIEIDVPRIEQVLSNLLGNAITHGDNSQPISVSGIIQGHRLELSVCNAGPPISEAAREHLFRPFLRDEVQRSQQGLGLGLYISSEIVNAHDGRLRVTSDNVETCFVVEIG